MLSSNFNFYSLMYFCIFFGQMADCVTTLKFLKYGIELNPIIDAVLSYSPAAFVTLKFVSAVILIFMISHIKTKSEIWGRRTAKIVLFLSIIPPLFNIATSFLSRVGI